MEIEMINNLGRALSIIVQHKRNEDAMHEDVNQFHAPSECHELVSRGEAKRFRLVRRRVKALTGSRYDLVLREARRRTSNHAVYRLGL